MATLTLRRLDDQVAKQFKQMAKEHGSSTEAELRSLVEDVTAGYIAHKAVTGGDLVRALRETLHEDEESEQAQADHREEQTSRHDGHDDDFQIPQRNGMNAREVDFG